VLQLAQLMGKHPLQQQQNGISSTAARWKAFNKPVSGNELPRTSGIASMYRLPVQQDTEGLDVAFVGVAMDIGTSNKSGTRHGPRAIRAESALVREYNKDTGACPYESLMVADVGDVNFTPYNLPQAVKDIRNGYVKLLSTGCKTLTLGGDHTITYPILQAYKEKYGPVGLVHVDAHGDTSNTMMGCTITHGTPFRRAVEEGLLDCKRVVQIGLRGSGYSNTDYSWAMDQGFRVVPARHCYHKSLVPLMEEVRQQMGDGPVYLSFDIDALDPAYAPGTGTPEMAGLTPIQALDIIWGCKGMNIIGGDLVEVSPPFDTTGITALTGAQLLFEMLCVFPGVRYEKPAV